ncbi:peptidase M48 [Synergistales bacterium]|nr:peptidase M48 [Synergistales bacterium]
MTKKFPYIIYMSALIMTFALFAGAVHAAPASVSGGVSSGAASDATPYEAKLAREGAASVEKSMTLVSNPAALARVDMIVSRLAPYMERRLPYKAKIIDHKMINAFAIAGGPLYVTTGMLGFVRTDLELAGVIAHEMAHADRKHVITQMARNDRMTLLAIAAIIASRGHGAAIMAANALQVAVMGAYSVDIEKNADAHGIDALANAGYNPIGMLTLQERMREDTLKRAYADPGIYRTHPDAEERIEASAKYMEERGLPLNRKYSLGVLRPAVSETSGDLRLTIDGRVVWKGVPGAAARELFDKTARVLDEVLQVEIAPYDIRVEDERQGEALFIEGRRVVSSGEVIEGTEPVAVLRENIQAVLSDVRKEYPLADFYR